MKHLLASFLIAVATPAMPDAASKANEAALMLSQAALSMEQADSATDRIAALTETVRAYEAGLSAMREGLLAGALKKRALEQDLQERDAELAGFLQVLQTVSKHGHVEALVHPGGMRDTINAGLLVSAFVPELQARAEILEGKLSDLAELTAVQENGVRTLDDGLAGTRSARQALADALVQRADLPPRRPTDEAAMLALLNSSETLQAFAAALLPDDAPVGDLTPASWEQPVDGALLREFGGEDAAGVRRPGVIFAAPAQSLVVAPTRANIRFSGEVPGQGVVVILEPVAGQLVILAGLGRSFVHQGQIVEGGAPLGLMSGEVLAAQENLNELLRNGSLLGQETLYMEVRQGRGPIDPMSLLISGDT